MIISSFLLIFFACIIIWRASDGFETASNFLGRNLSDGVRGATINAIGSSMPELITTLFFLFILRDKDGFAGGIGTTAGSAIFNGMIIPALIILVVIFKNSKNYVTVSRKVILRDGIALLLCELILIFLLGDKYLDWIHGAILMILYVCYAVYMMKTMDKKDEEEIDFEPNTIPSDDQSIDKPNDFFYNLLSLDLESILIKEPLRGRNAWILLAVSIMVISVACFFLVKSCEWIGEALGVPIYFIAVVLASAATSVPDTILSVKDAQKGNYDDAVSNALGSNIFDVCFALGFPLFLFTLIYGPIEMSQETLMNVSELRILLFLLTLLAFLIFIAKDKMGGKSAFLLLLLYITFTLFILGKSVNSEYSNGVSSSLSEINYYIDQVRFWSK
jgi:Ca2+/Na+ antiporter